MNEELYHALKRSLDAERPVALVTVVAGAGLGRQLLVRPDGTGVGGLGSTPLDEEGGRRAQVQLASFGWERWAGEAEGKPVELFVETIAPRPTLIVIGAVHIAVPLVHMAAAAGFRTCVIDPRAAFATAERFGHADELIAACSAEVSDCVRLNASSFVAVLSHDQKIDVPALSLALRSPARYIGVLGSRKTQAKRVAALREAGHTDEEIARISSPIGLDLGARTPEEIAVAVIAEVVATLRGR